VSVVSMRRPSSKKGIPTESELLAIPLAATGEYEISDLETKRLRVRVYALNKNNASFRWRTMREAPYTILWKLRK
jgi:hypothetical protein